MNGELSAVLALGLVKTSTLALLAFNTLVPLPFPFWFHCVMLTMLTVYLIFPVLNLDINNRSDISLGFWLHVKMTPCFSFRNLNDNVARVFSLSLTTAFLARRTCPCGFNEVICSWKHLETPGSESVCQSVCIPTNGRSATVWEGYVSHRDHPWIWVKK